MGLRRPDALAHGGAQARVQMRVAGDDVAALPRVAAVRVGRVAAGLADDAAMPAAMSHGFRPSSQNPSNRPAATQARSSAAEPKRRMPATCGISVASVRANAAARGADAANGMPVANIASFKSRRAETRSRRSFRKAPAPFSAQNISSTAGA